DVVAEIGEGSHDAIVAPTAVLLGHADDQRFHLSAGSRASRIGAMLGSIEFASDQTTIPAENRFGLGNTGYIGEQLAGKPLANFSKCAPLGVAEPEGGG